MGPRFQYPISNVQCPMSNVQCSIFDIRYSIFIGVLHHGKSSRGLPDSIARFAGRRIDGQREAGEDGRCSCGVGLSEVLFLSLGDRRTSAALPTRKHSTAGSQITSSMRISAIRSTAPATRRFPAQCKRPMAASPVEAARKPPAGIAVPVPEGPGDL